MTITPLQKLRLILEHIALIAHGGALIGFENESDALIEIRKHTKPFIGDRINSLQRNQTTDDCTRAADLLERQAAPVPVAGRPWEREGWCDEEGRCWWGRAADEFCNHDWHYSTRAEVEECCSDAMPQVTLPHDALPLPSGEVEK